MAERVTKIITPQTHADKVAAFLKEENVTMWQEENDDDQAIYAFLSELEQTEKLTDALQQRFGGVQGFHMVVMAVQATISTPENDEKNEKESSENTSREVLPLRISREELYADVEAGARYSRVFILMVALSTIVASIGLLRDNVAVIIGAMVIAPLLGPNVAMALATTLADKELGIKAAKSFIPGSLLAFTLSLAMGMVLTVDPCIAEIESRTALELTDVVLALAAGCAGVLAFTTGASGAVIGVMVAVALLPPLAVSGLLMGSANYPLALNAFLLFACNVICVNLAGVLTFFLQGVRPRHWWEANRAKRFIRTAIFAWLAVLLVLLAILYLFAQ